ncbi:MAG: SusC/RagA family TonB-linked outer membrane protein, partial [Bacteroidetes bacterium]
MPTTLRGFVTVVFLFSINLFFAQQKTISGTVTDNFDQPLPGANIVVQGTTRGTTANFEGYYKIRASEGETLAISYIGYLTQTLVIGPGFTFDVSLEPGNNLDEVIVVGYGTTTRRELTDNITSVGAEQIKEIPVPSIQG